MTKAAQAYGKVANQISSPREMEADKLLFAASQLQGIRDSWDDKKSELNAALLNNRKLWSVLVTSVTRPENPLPDTVRQNVANLGIFVLKQTIAAQAEPEARPARLADQYQPRTGVRLARPRLTFHPLPGIKKTAVWPRSFIFCFCGILARTPGRLPARYFM